MLNKQISTVLFDYEAYQYFLGGNKCLSATTIILSRKKNNKDRLYETCPICLKDMPCAACLIVEANAIKSTYYGFKLQVDLFPPSPCFRFDADGQAHNNRCANIPLPERQVTTPHFHRYIEDGTMIAYKTDALKRDGDAKAIQQDINFAMTHFCHEANIRHDNGDFPEVFLRQGELASTDTIDPLNGVSF